jgi:hypothetical protein
VCVDLLHLVIRARRVPARPVGKGQDEAVGRARHGHLDVLGSGLAVGRNEQARRALAPRTNMVDIALAAIAWAHSACLALTLGSKDGKPHNA